MPAADAPRHRIERRPVIVQFRETAAFTETYGFTGSQGSVFLEGQQIVPKDHPSDTVLVFMHPASTLNLMPLPVALAGAGFHVLSCASRYAKNDTALIMEKVAADLGAYIRHARDDLGYRHVILCGWSGGGSLAMFYQAQAERPTITETPAGDAYDLTRADLPPADAALFLAAHTGRARILSEWIDPSVTDEDDPLDAFDPLMIGPHAVGADDRVEAVVLGTLGEITVEETFEAPGRRLGRAGIRLGASIGRRHVDRRGRCIEGRCVGGPGVQRDRVRRVTVAPRARRRIDRAVAGLAVDGPGGIGLPHGIGCHVEECHIDG